MTQDICMKYARYIIVTLLLILTAIAWLTPSNIEWQSTKLQTCVDHEMSQQAHNSETVEKAIELILKNQCALDFEQYVEAFTNENKNKYKNIINDPPSMRKVHEKFKQIAIIYLSTFHVK